MLRGMDEDEIRVQTGGGHAPGRFILPNSNLMNHGNNYVVGGVGGGGGGGGVGGNPNSTILNQSIGEASINFGGYATVGGGGKGRSETDNKSITSTPSKISKFTYSGKQTSSVFESYCFSEFIGQLSVFVARIPASEAHQPIVHEHRNDQNSHVGCFAWQHHEYSESSSKVQSESATTHQGLPMDWRSCVFALLSHGHYCRRPSLQSQDQVPRWLH